MEWGEFLTDWEGFILGQEETIVEQEESICKGDESFSMLLWETFSDKEDSVYESSRESICVSFRQSEDSLSRSPVEAVRQ